MRLNTFINVYLLDVIIMNQVKMILILAWRPTIMSQLFVNFLSPFTQMRDST